jgi:hypothetical protein
LESSRTGSPCSCGASPASSSRRKCAYLLFSDAYREQADEAGRRGWCVGEISGAKHLHTVVDPVAVTDALLCLTSDSRAVRPGLKLGLETGVGLERRSLREGASGQRRALSVAVAVLGIELFGGLRRSQATVRRKARRAL